jgi:hypothetical protein
VLDAAQVFGPTSPGSGGPGWERENVEVLGDDHVGEDLGRLGQEQVASV